MAQKLKSDPEGCACPKLRGERDCIDCFFEQVNEKNEFTGSQLCWDAQCIVIDHDYD